MFNRKCLIMFLTIILGIGIVNFAAVSNKQCNGAHDGGESTLSEEGCDTTADLGNKETTDAIKGHCNVDYTNFTCYENYSVTSIWCDIYECAASSSSSSGVTWNDTETDEEIENVDDCYHEYTP